MNRAKRYSGPFALTVAVLAFGAGLYLGVVAFTPKPEIRTVVQSPVHGAAFMSGSALTQAAEDLAECRAKNRALQSMTPPSNREGQIPAVTPQPYRLHPGKTPLVDPTQDAYYKKLLEQGRFPTSGSAEGRPDWTDYDEEVILMPGHRPATQIRHRHSDGRDGVGPGQYCQRDKPDHERRPQP